MFLPRFPSNDHNDTFEPQIWRIVCTFGGIFISSHLYRRFKSYGSTPNEGTSQISPEILDVSRQPSALKVPRIFRDVLSASPKASTHSSANCSFSCASCSTQRSARRSLWRSNSTFCSSSCSEAQVFLLKLKSHFLSNISNFLYFVMISQLGSIKTRKLLPTQEKLQFPQNLQTPPTCFICCCSRCARSIAICSNLCVVSTSRASRNVASNAFRLALSPRSNDSTWRWTPSTPGFWDSRLTIRKHI